MRIFLSGASGNVGRAIIRNIQKERDLELAGGWCKEAGQDLGTIAGLAPLGITATDSIAEGLAEACPYLVIDFSVTTVLEDNMRTYLDLNLDALIGTTGLTEEQLEPFIEDHTSDVYMDGIFLTVRNLPHMAPGTFVRDLAEIRRVR
jgi:4-hydroxy-tetrahydrodipicolinate reductase